MRNNPDAFAATKIGLRMIDTKGQEVTPCPFGFAGYGESKCGWPNHLTTRLLGATGALATGDEPPPGSGIFAVETISSSYHV